MPLIVVGDPSEKCPLCQTQVQDYLGLTRHMNVIPIPLFGSMGTNVLMTICYSLLESPQGEMSTKNADSRWQ